MSAQILVAVSRPYFTEDKHHFKQIMATIVEVTLWYNKQRDLDDIYIQKLEIKNMIELYNKFKMK